MKFIDCHAHPCFDSRLFQLAAKENGIRFYPYGYFKEMSSAGIEKSVAIGIDIKSNNLIAKLAKDSDRIIPIMGVKKSELNAQLKSASDSMSDGVFKGVKIFLGYDPIFADSKSLNPFYRLAEKFTVPVIFHTGDTWTNPKNYSLDASEKESFMKSKIKYAHPLRIDDVAVDHPDMKIIIAHAGNPWVDDAAELIFRNDNCYADISGWFVNSIDSYYEKLMIDKLNSLISFAGVDKLMFGTDWPLIKMEKYTKFILNSGLKNKFLKSIAYKNAERFWSL